MSASKPKPTGSSRESAQQLRLEHDRREKRSRLLVRWGIIGGVLAVLAVIAVVIVSSIRPDVPAAGPAPAHGNEYGGITLASPTELAATAASTVDAEAALEETSDTPAGVEADAGPGPVQVVAWVDVNCVHCADFEATYSAQIQQWLDDGDVTLEYRTVAFLDRNSTSAYSSRAANALACVADTAPQAYQPFTQALFGNFPNGELGDDELSDLAESSGAGDISTCVDEGTFRPWVDFTTNAASSSGIAGTPTVYIDGEPLASPADFVTGVEAAIEARDA